MENPFWGFLIHRGRWIGWFVFLLPPIISCSNQDPAAPLAQYLSVDGLAGPDMRSMPDTRTSLHGSAALQGLYDDYGEQLVYRWDVGDWTLNAQERVLDGEPGVDHVYTEFGIYTVTLHILRKDALLASDTLEINTYQWYSDREARAYQARLPEAHKAALAVSNQGVRWGYANLVLQQLGLAVLPLEVIEGIFGGCVNFSIYRLSPGFQLLVDENACMPQSVAIYSLEEEGPLFSGTETWAP